jgi:hypothetical protein
MSLPSAASLRRGLSLLENFCVIFGLKLTWPSFIGGRKSGSFCTDRTEDMLLSCNSFKKKWFYIDVAEPHDLIHVVRTKAIEFFFFSSALRKSNKTNAHLLPRRFSFSFFPSSSALFVSYGNHETEN